LAALRNSLREDRQSAGTIAQCRNCLNATADAESLAAPGALSRFVHPSSERTLESVRRDNSFPEKQESHPARLLVVQRTSRVSATADARISDRAEELAFARRHPSATARRIRACAPSWNQRVSHVQGRSMLL